MRRPKKTIHSAAAPAVAMAMAKNVESPKPKIGRTSDVSRFETSVIGTPGETRRMKRDARRVKPPRRECSTTMTGWGFRWPKAKT